MKSRMSSRTQAALRAAVNDPRTRERYWDKVALPSADNLLSGSACWIWMGAISGVGHGRLWLSKGAVVIAHRFAFALATDDAEQAIGVDILAHGCNNPLCQRVAPGHVQPSSAQQNSASAKAQAHVIGSPLRDVRGSRARAEVLRAAARQGIDVAQAAQDGVPLVDRLQLPLIPSEKPTERF